MDKKILTIIVVVIALGALFFLGRGLLPTSLEETQSLSVPEDVAGVDLTAEELQALKDEGLELPSGADAEAKKLQTVRSSDELDAIEADLGDTDLSGLAL